jgi:hypothetical protein
MTYKPRRERRARGGKADMEPLHPEHGHQYNAQGSPEEKEESAKSDGFRRGGAAKKKRKEGGHVEGHAAKHHLGKRARGGGAHKPHVEMHMGEHHEHHGGGEHAGGHHHEEMPHRARGGHVKHRERGGSAFSEGRKLVAPPVKGSEKENGPGENAPTIP